MRKILPSLDEVGFTCYVDLCVGCEGLWSHDRFTKYVLGYGAPYILCTSRVRLGL